MLADTTDQLTGFIVAGHDTTSTTISWGLKLLTDHPQAQSHLREALRAAHAAAMQEGRAPTQREISSTSVPLLDATIEEILRMGGTTTLLERQCNTDTTLLGHHIPKGTLLIMAQRGPSITTPGQTKNASKKFSSDGEAGGSYQVPNWDDDDIELFRPERWLTKDENGNDVYDSQAGPMLAFGGGMRGCFGRRLAYVQLKLLVTMLVWHFEFLACPEELSSYARIEGLTQKPKQCYIRAQKVV
jgi:cytochrome P450